MSKGSFKIIYDCAVRNNTEIFLYDSVRSFKKKSIAAGFLYFLVTAALSTCIQACTVLTDWL